MYQNIPTKVLTGEVRLSYANLTTPPRRSAGAGCKVLRNPADPQNGYRYKGEH